MPLKTPSHKAVANGLSTAAAAIKKLTPTLMAL
jgi:hypothetical protein